MEEVRPTLDRQSKRPSAAFALLAFASIIAPLAAQTPPPIPRLVHAGPHYQLEVDGKPFIMLEGFQAQRAGGLIIELAPCDYIVPGHGFRLQFEELEGPPRSPEFLSIEEGTFKGTEWSATRRLNGDELHVNLLQKAEILRVRPVR